MKPTGRCRAALCDLIRVAPWVAGGVLLAAALVERTTIVQVTGERDRLVTVVSDATLDPDAGGQRRPLTLAQALAYRRAARQLVSKRIASPLARPQEQKAASARRSLAADVALARAQAVNAVRFARAAPRIAALARAKPTGDADTDAAAVERDSRAPWESWQ